jgi:hypothetical protein
MAPRTIGGLVGGMAHGGHIHHENYGLIGVNGLAPTSTISHSLDLHLGNMSYVAHRELYPKVHLPRGASTLACRKSWPSFSSEKPKDHGS